MHDLHLRAEAEREQPQAPASTRPRATNSSRTNRTSTEQSKQRVPWSKFPWSWSKARRQARADAQGPTAMSDHRRRGSTRTALPQTRTGGHASRSASMPPSIHARCPPSWVSMEGTHTEEGLQVPGDIMIANAKLNQLPPAWVVTEDGDELVCAVLMNRILMSAKPAAPPLEPTSRPARPTRATPQPAVLLVCTPEEERPEEDDLQPQPQAQPPVLDSPPVVPTFRI